MQQINVHKGRTVVVQVSLGVDISNDEFKSEIRVGKSQASSVIVEWNVSFLTDGTDGELILTLDDSVTKEVKETTGYMDIKRITGGEPVPVFDEILEVLFKETITE